MRRRETSPPPGRPPAQLARPVPSQAAQSRRAGVAEPRSKVAMTTARRERMSFQPRPRQAGHAFGSRSRRAMAATIGPRRTKSHPTQSYRLGISRNLRFHDLQKFGFAEGYAAGPGWMPRWLNRVAMSV